MDTLTAARTQMEVSLAFHMVFAALGIGMPLMMAIAEGLWLRTGRPHYRDLARKWAKATALTFAVGAVSGTALSFELGLLWPRFMRFAGGIVGPAFALEGYAFFLEAIFLGLYLYGWEKLSPRAHWLSGVAVAASGMASGILVVAANAWMQTPAGFRGVVDGQAVGVSPFAPFLSPAWFQMSLHSTVSCYVATGFAAGGVYALGMLRGRRDAYHRSGLGIALAVAAVTGVLQPLSGDISAKNVARWQPAKLAAMEAHFRTGARVPLLIGGIPDAANDTVRWAIRIPRGLSFLATGDADATVRGLDAFPRDERPNVLISHLAFQVMVGCGTALAALGMIFWIARWRKREDARLLLWALLAASPLGFLALEAGWIVTEVGRQPWVVYGVMRTADGVTPVGEVPATLFGFSVLYLALGIALALLLRRLATGAPASDETVDVTQTPEVAGVG
ncbi:MAG TPA: cytochrome ubiquinol oxidase subunit I [Longimicrobiaceae bacterium]|jgi:cytochrome d ubiquinol oxidase subunit I|nr:cytochrome ubiquinol oxidase subunit I [Longimicrobiaceae bacterium]